MIEFSFEQYKKLIEHYKSHIPYMDYADVTKDTDSFFVLRHDIEYSIDRSYELGLFEKEQLDMNTTFLIQIRNNTYNPFSERNLSLIQDIYSMGHKIGLHVHLDGCKEKSNPKS